MLETLLTILGIGLLLFLHEMGHFLAARAAGVRVEVFSLGFGPRLAGWERHGTDFRISLFPIGGYVRMAGEEQQGTPRPGELGAASPGWRFLIYSGGILMNFAFALVLFPVLFRIGLPMPAPVAGAVEPGGPAWEAGLREGERFLSVAGRRTLAWQHVVAAVALAPAGEAVDVVTRDPAGARHEYRILPREDGGLRRIGVGGPLVHPSLRAVVAEDGAAWEAGLRTGDRILALHGLAVRTPQEARIAFEYALLRSEPLPLEWESSAGRRRSAVLPLVPPAEDQAPQIGIRELRNRVVAVRRASPLEGRLLPGDEILSAGGEVVLQPADLAAACLRRGHLPELRVQRAGEILFLEEVPEEGLPELLADLALDTHPELRVALVPGGPAERAGLRTGDTLLRVDGRPVDGFEELRRTVQAAAGRSLRFLVAASGEEEPRSVEVRPEAMPRPDFGFAFEAHEEPIRSDSVGEAVLLGLGETRSMILEIFATLRGLLTGELQAEDSIGGIVTIATATHAFAEAGLLQLLFFLCMISINLGVLNLLPIPALDGGHLLLVTIEKLRGRPVSERTQMWFHLLGFVVVLALILFVTLLDIRRLLQ